MASLSRESRIIQNPALGATLLWRFTVGYCTVNNTDCPPLQLLFIVLPMLFHEETGNILKSTQQKSGLRAFISKFADSKLSKNDLLLSIQSRALQMRKLTLESIRMSVMSNLVSIDHINATMIPISKTEARMGVPTSIKNLMKNSEKLGSWCAELTLFEIATILKIRF